jgi:hypothetical protein
MHQLRRRVALILTSGLLVVAATAASAPATAAKDGDVIRTGSCSGAADWKLKLSPENGKIEVEFEVDQNKAGKTWAVKIKRNGNVLASGTRVTKAPSGSFEFRALVSNRPGADTIVARARNLASGQVCRGVATI